MLIAKPLTKKALNFTTVKQKWQNEIFDRGFINKKFELGTSDWRDTRLIKGTLDW